MKKKTKLFALLLALVLLTTVLAACGAQSKSAEADYAASEPAAAYEEMKTETAIEAPAEEAVAEEGFSTTASAGNGTVTEGQLQPTIAEKIIYSGHVNIETTAFDEALAALEQTVRELEGFVQDSAVEGYTRHYDDGTTAVVDRWAHYVVRIPADRFDAFMQKTGDIGSVTSSNRTAENVTSQYTDFEARLSSLKLQEERLLEMLAQSGKLEDLITLESRLSDVRYEIENIERNLRNLDQRLAYSTVTLNLQEVEIYTPTVAVQRTFGEKLSDAFSSGIRSFVRGLQNLILGLVRNLLGLVVFAAVVVVLVVIVRRVLRRMRKKLHARKQPEQNEKPKEKPEQE